MSWIWAALATTTGSLYASVAGWSIYDNQDSCALVSEYESSALLWISHNYRLKRTTFLISNPAFKSVTDDKEYNLDLRFIKDGVLDDGWGQVSARGVVLEGGNGVRFTLRGDEALDDVARSKVIGLLRDDIVVASLDLKGSTAAVEKLRQCARAVDRRNPTDPLEGAEKSKRSD